MKKIITAAIAALICASNFTAYAAADAVTSGTGRDDVRIALGSPSERSANGTKEVFTLSDGSDAIIIYNEWGYVAHGYIVR